LLHRMQESQREVGAVDAMRDGFGDWTGVEGQWTGVGRKMFELSGAQASEEVLTHGLLIETQVSETRSELARSVIMCRAKLAASAIAKSPQWVPLV